MSMKGTADDHSDELDQSRDHAIAGMGIVTFSVAGDSVGGARGGCDGCIPQARGAICDRDRRAWADARGAPFDCRDDAVGVAHSDDRGVPHYSAAVPVAPIT